MSNKRILPAYPLFVKDPNFSLWSVTEELNKSHVQSWWGAEKRLYGFLKTQGNTYCFLGNGEDFANCGVQCAEQISLAVTAFSTDYAFRAGGIELKVKFVSPLLPDDPEMIALPVCYLEYEIEGGADAEISLFVNRTIAYNEEIGCDHSVCGAAADLNGFECAFLGRKRQMYLSNNGDKIGADWGYWYVAGEEAFFLDACDLAAYLTGGLKCFSAAGEECYIGAFNNTHKGILALGYDDVVSIQYYGEFRKGYYLQDHTIIEALQTVWNGYRKTDERLAAFDKELQKKAAPFGKSYLDLLYASLRQSVSSHKLIKDTDGTLLFLSKECDSNGCIATVDVSYPSMPLFLLYNTELVKGMMRPILKYARMPAWPYDFVPHDAGTYPNCCGNVYGFTDQKSKYTGTLRKEDTNTWFPVYLLPARSQIYDMRYQMSVEECANLLIMWYACYHCDKDISFFAENADLAEKWVEYLVKYGLKPEEQLCTDDFAGHLKNNLNLAIKATVGIACYAELLNATGGGERGAEYRKTAEEFAAEITAFANRFPHLPISWDADDSTFSLKYNFAFDKILRLGLFPQEVLEREVDCYLKKANAFGTPLDNRETYSKTDWITWAAALTDDAEKRTNMIAYLDKFLKESPHRVPFSDWYRTQNGEHVFFRARTVQGGCFILLL